jgi:hypothetical protein
VSLRLRRQSLDRRQRSGFGSKAGDWRLRRCDCLADRIQSDESMSRSQIVVALILGLVLLAPAWIVTVMQRDAWPFSCYPMFSRPNTPETMSVFRIAFQYSNGTMRWWTPHFYKLQHSLGVDLRPFTGSHSQRVRVRRSRALRIIARCAQEDSMTPPADYLCIVRRRCVLGTDGRWKTIDRVVARIKVSEPNERTR